MIELISKLNKGEKPSIRCPSKVVEQFHEDLFNYVNNPNRDNLNNIILKVWKFVEIFVNTNRMIFIFLEIEKIYFVYIYLYFHNRLCFYFISLFYVLNSFIINITHFGY